jgi:hypothetical protein
MNVIFIDFDGALSTLHKNKVSDIEEKIKLLSDICKEYDAKVVIESAHKESIDPDTLTTESEYATTILNLFNKYNIDCIGVTPKVKRIINDYSCYEVWKEDEIRKYLFNHPEIDHYCILDDDDLYPNNSDLKKVSNHLLRLNNYSHNIEEEGLLPKHKEEIGLILKKDNEIKKYALEHIKSKTR